MRVTSPSTPSPWRRHRFAPGFTPRAAHSAARCEARSQFALAPHLPAAQRRRSGSRPGGARGLGLEHAQQGGELEARAASRCRSHPSQNERHALLGHAQPSASRGQRRARVAQSDIRWAMCQPRCVPITTTSLAGSTSVGVEGPWGRDCPDEVAGTVLRLLALAPSHGHVRLPAPLGGRARDGVHCGQACSAHVGACLPSGRRCIRNGGANWTYGQGNAD